MGTINTQPIQRPAIPTILAAILKRRQTITWLKIAGAYFRENGGVSNGTGSVLKSEDPNSFITVRLNMSIAALWSDTVLIRNV